MNNTNYINLLDRLNKLRDDNPDFADVLTKAIPEVEDTKPFIFENQLFMRENNTANIYHLTCINREFRITNLRYNTVWVNVLKVEATQTCENLNYITKTQFNKMTKRTGLSYGAVKVLDMRSYQNLYHDLWKNL